MMLPLRTVVTKTNLAVRIKKELATLKKPFKEVKESGLIVFTLLKDSIVISVEESNRELVFMAPIGVFAPKKAESALFELTTRALDLVYELRSLDFLDEKTNNLFLIGKRVWRVTTDSIGERFLENQIYEFLKDIDIARKISTSGKK